MMKSCPLYQVWRDPAFRSGITGGYVAVPGSWPWQAPLSHPPSSPRNMIDRFPIKIKTLKYTEWEKGSHIHIPTVQAYLVYRGEFACGGTIIRWDQHICMSAQIKQSATFSVTNGSRPPGTVYTKAWTLMEHWWILTQKWEFRGSKPSSEMIILVKLFLFKTRKYGYLSFCWGSAKDQWNPAEPPLYET